MSQARVALAVDLGGTKVEAALVDGDGRVDDASRSRQPTGPDVTPATLTAAIADVVRSACERIAPGDSIVGVGVGSAGPIDETAGTISPVNMPGVRGFPLVAAVTDAVVASTGDPDPAVTLRHDGACLALAESWLGEAAGARASLSIVVSTGVGGGIVVNGVPVGGSTGNAGHIGQTVIDDLTLEEVASGPSSVRWAQLHGWRGATGEDLARDAGGDIPRRAIIRSAEAVGRGIVNAAALLDVDTVVISGGFSRVSEDYVDLVQQAVIGWATLPFIERVRVVRSSLGADGPLIGAAALVLR